MDHHPSEPGEKRSLRSMDKEGMKACIRRDLSWLMNTRTPIPGSRFDKEPLTVIDYGIPDFGANFTENRDDVKQIARRIKRAILFFEPRLADVSVFIRPEKVTEKQLAVFIEADMMFEAVREPISFMTVLDRNTGVWEIHEHNPGNTP